jgi:hypothetical protein
MAGVCVVEPGYFASVGIRHSAGRALDERDTGRAPPVVSIDEEFARVVFPGEDPIGRRITIVWSGGVESVSYEIVGVVGSVRHRGPASPPSPTVYLHRGHDSSPYWMHFAHTITVRTSVDPLALARDARRVVWSIDPTVPITELGAFDRILDRHVAGARYTDVRDVLARAEHLVPGVTRDKRLPMLAFYVIFHRMVAPAQQRTGWQEFIGPYLGEFDEPSLESLVAHVVLNERTDWSADHLNELWEQYLGQRNHKRGLHVGPLFEAAIILTVAEAYRSENDHGTAKALVSSAVENRPGDRQVLELEYRLGGDDNMTDVIDWTAVLLPAP